MSNLIQNRYEFVLLYDVTLGNPNGDPDADNEPRRDDVSDLGLVSGPAIKRKIRNYVEIARPKTEGYRIHITQGAILSDAHNKYLPKGDALVKPEDLKKARDAMCKEFFDVRTFGAVLTNKRKGGNDNVHGPVQIFTSASIDPIQTQRHTITRCAVSAEQEGKANQTMGGYWTVPYALYRVHGSVSAPLAAKTGFNQDDLDLFWESLVNMWEHDRSSSRGEMHPVALAVFKHSTALGNAPSRTLYDRVTVKRRVDSPLGISDYAITIDSAVTKGVEIITMLAPPTPAMASAAA